MDEPSNVTALLQGVSRGDREAQARLVPMVYDTLKRLAHRALWRERPGHTLSTTALAHEAYIELAGMQRVEWKDRAHFFAMASHAIRRILVDYAVARNAQKRGGGAVAVDLDDVVLVDEQRLDDMLIIDQALTRLAALEPRAVRIVECRVLVGLTIEETAAALDISPATVKRQWTAARAWLTRELTRGTARE